MTFRIFQNSTTADASDSNDNFYHIAQGTITPLQGTLLGNTTSTLDLGSETYKWNNLYINSIPSLSLNSGGATWEHKAREVLTLDSSRVEITGLDTPDISFFMTFLLKTATSTAAYVNMYVNGFSTGVATTRQWIQSSVTTVVSFAFTVTSDIVLTRNAGTTATSLWTWGYFYYRYFNNASGEAASNLGYVQAFTGGESYSDQNIFSLISLPNTSTSGTLTSIQIIPQAGDLLAGSIIDVWSLSEERLT
jgi:hypothetical protein